MEDREPYITGGNVDRLIKFSFMWQDMKTGEWLDKRYTLDEIIDGDPYDDMSDSPLLRNFVHKHTRQFTGLTDDDKEIYENDIIEKPKGIGVVEFFYFGTWHAKEISTGDSLTLGGDMANVTLIGNIYENSELLK